MLLQGSAFGNTGIKVGWRGPPPLVLANLLWKNQSFAHPSPPPPPRQKRENRLSWDELAMSLLY